MLHLGRRWQLFALQPFRWYVLSCFLVNVGAGLLYINLTWLSLKIYNSVESVALLMLSFWLPVVVCGPLAGIIADRFSRKNIIIFCIFARAAVLFIFYLYWQFGYTVLLWQMCLLFFIQGIALGFVLPALMAFIREIVPPKDLLYANTTADIAYEIGNFVGMGGAGFVIALTSINFGLLVNALCFLFAGIALLIIKMTGNRSAEVSGLNWVASIYHDYLSGIRYLLNNKRLCILYCAQLFAFTIFLVSPVFLVPFAKNVLHTSVQGFGGLETAVTIGVILGGLFSPWFANRFGIIRVILAELIILFSSYLSFSLNSNFVLAVGLNVFVGIGFSVWSLLVTLAQSETELNFQGRVQSTFNSLSGLMIITIYLLMAFYGPVFSIRALYGVQVLLALFAIIFLIAYKIADNKTPIKLL